MGICASASDAALQRSYALEEDHILEEGAYATIFMGKCKKTGEPVAIKRIAKLPNMLPRVWEDEIAVLRRCGQHPTILQFKQVLESNTHVFIVTELVAGGELFDVLINVREEERRGKGRMEMNQGAEMSRRARTRNTMHAALPETCWMRSAICKNAISSIGKAPHHATGLRTGSDVW